MPRRSMPSRKNGKLPPWTLAKSNHVYDRRQVLGIYNKTDNTITNWIKEGLPVSYDGAKQLFFGADLNIFHRNRAMARRHICDGANLYCVRCKKPHPPVGMVCKVRDEEGASYKVITWICSGCRKVATCFAYSRAQARLAAAGVALNPSEKSGDS